MSGACALVAWSALALAQPRPRDVECKPTETQAECHARLKCKADEELEDCQKRLLRCKAGEGLGECKKRTGGGKQGGDEAGGDEGGAGGAEQGDRGGEDRGDRGGDDGGGGEDRGDRWHREGGGDDGGGGEDRGDRWHREGGDDGGGGGGGRGDRGRGGGGGGGDYGYKTFGLGLELGEPTGLNGKYFFSDRGALDFGVGWIYRHYYYDDGLHIYADFLWHPAVLASSGSLAVPFYIGLGLRYWDFEYCDGPFCYDGSAIGIRVPIGVAFDFTSAPVDIFMQVVPTLDFIEDDYYDRYGDRTHLGIDASVGIRYWFK